MQTSRLNSEPHTPASKSAPPLPVCTRRQQISHTPAEPHTPASKPAAARPRCARRQQTGPTAASMHTPQQHTVNTQTPPTARLSLASGCPACARPASRAASAPPPPPAVPGILPASRGRFARTAASPPAVCGRGGVRPATPLVYNSSGVGLWGWTVLFFCKRIRGRFILTPLCWVCNAGLCEGQAEAGDLCFECGS